MTDFNETGSIKTGFREADEVIGGLLPSQLITVAARSGKTAFVLDVVCHAVLDENKNAAVFLPEVSEKEALLRMISSRTRINIHRLRAGALSDAEREAAADMENRLTENKKLFFGDSPKQKPEIIRPKCRRLADEGRRPQLIAARLPDPDVKLVHRSPIPIVSCNYERVITEMKKLALEMECPLLMAAALPARSELFEDPEGKRPQPDELDYHVSALSDVILLLHRPGFYRGIPRPAEESGGPEMAELIVARRSGSSVTLGYDSRYLTFRDAPEE
ncbi:MAG: DnaB-like helicase C-terminal domain-containing protein [Abditibacteriota bacterium]|nr:DnaB-like helicase C-terminal domain-containing protein [Abditibacteriota bacterium]